MTYITIVFLKRHSGCFNIHDGAVLFFYPLRRSLFRHLTLMETGWSRSLSELHHNHWNCEMWPGSDYMTHAKCCILRKGWSTRVESLFWQFKRVWISSISVRVLVLCMLAHCHTITSYWDTCNSCAFSFLWQTVRVNQLFLFFCHWLYTA